MAEALGPPVNVSTRRIVYVRVIVNPKTVPDRPIVGRRKPRQGTRGRAQPQHVTIISCGHGMWHDREAVSAG